MQRLITALLLMFTSHIVAAEIRVAATVPNMGMLVQEIGGDAVDVTVMAPPDRDIHYLEARPSMMAALRRADMVVAVGAELEVGWLPAAIDGANNPEVRPGRGGYFEGATHVDLIDEGRPADRAAGDVHPHGNPHFYMDPERMATVGFALAERLARFDGERADEFLANAQRFADAVAERMPSWKAAASGAPGVVLHHEDGNYLMERLNVPIHGFLEPLPGIPPTARHLRELVTALRGREGTIIHQVFQPADGAEFLGNELGWSVHRLPSQVERGEDVHAYLRMIDRWVEAVSR